MDVKYSLVHLLSCDQRNEVNKLFFKENCLHCKTQFFFEVGRAQIQFSRTSAQQQTQFYIFFMRPLSFLRNNKNKSVFENEAKCLVALQFTRVSIMSFCSRIIKLISYVIQIFVLVDLTRCVCVCNRLFDIINCQAEGLSLQQYLGNSK